MIAFVQGTLEEIGDSYAVVQSSGVGFRIFTPIREELIRAGIGSQVRFHTYLSVREDAMILYGFLDRDSLGVFKQLISVSGVGPKLGLAILSALSASEVAMAVASEDRSALSSVSGVGKKTAERIILELKEKISVGTELDLGPKVSSASVSAAGTAARDAIMALVQLGYSQQEASSAVRSCGASPEADAEDIIKAALKQLF